MARKTKSQIREEQVAEEREAERKEALKERLRLLREADAILWQIVDRVSATILKLITDGDPNGLAALKVRGRIPTSITIGYDDGWSYHAKRRLGGLQTRPVIAQFEHSDPVTIGSVEQAIEFNLGEVDGVVRISGLGFEEPESAEHDGD